SNLVKTVDNLSTPVYFRYDELNRRSRIAYPNETQYFEYDALGNMTKAAERLGTLSWTYDALSRVTHKGVRPSDGIDFGYDTASNLRKMRLGRPDVSAYYSYDEANRMTRATSLSGRDAYYQYDASSNMSKKRYPNTGVVAYYSYDKAERISNLRYFKSGAGVAYFDYSRDAAGRITKINREGNK